jgi:hypothetical protein
MPARQKMKRNRVMSGFLLMRRAHYRMRRLREYLLGGGFLYADDGYGMDKFFREEMKKFFPDKQ